ncbi:mechanosensitive ion channel family protein [Hymenobacter bucti]|uniref:Mechanosensitive ion channel family protein n=1 Tax=Hymenobacter bucti TaxID=1844114 RepID=A0ABW4QSV4_9BACT
MERLSSYSEQLRALVLLYLPRVAMALLVLVVGFWIIRLVSQVASRAMAGLEVSLRGFLTSMVSVVLKVLLVISVAGMIGLQTTSFVAVLGAAGLAVGLALQGTLANFAGGVLILMFKPFAPGDVIESQGKTGVVKAIHIFDTILSTPQGDTIILPNGALSNNILVNKTTENKVLVEVLVDVDGQTNLDELRALVLPLLTGQAKVLAEPAPSVGMVALVPGGMTVACRAYTLPGDNDAVHGALIEQIQRGLLSHGIQGPAKRKKDKKPA